jgi:hypothetical protein
MTYEAMKQESYCDGDVADECAVETPTTSMLQAECNPYRNIKKTLFVSDNAFIFQVHEVASDKIRVSNNPFKCTASSLVGDCDQVACTSVLER